jgi:hypothetical protein
MNKHTAQTDRGAIIAAVIVGILGPLIVWFITNQQSRADQQQLQTAIVGLQTQLALAQHTAAAAQTQLTISQAENPQQAVLNYVSTPDQTFVDSAASPSMVPSVSPSADGVVPTAAAVASSTPEPSPTITRLPTPTALPTTLNILTAHSSSAHDSSIGLTFWATNAIDGNTNTYWEATNDVGAWIELILPQQHLITTIALHTTGSGNDSQIENATLSFADGSEQLVKLDGTAGWQFVELEPVSSNTVRIRVDSVYPGIYYRRLLLTEVQLKGR